MTEIDYTAEALWDLSGSLAGPYLAAYEKPWEALGGIEDLIRRLGVALDPAAYAEVYQDVWIARTAKVANSASITGPCIIGPHTEIRHAAYIRTSALIGSNCVVGNSTELKNVILFDHVEVPHFNYVGDSILGSYAHLGAGAIVSNVRGDKGTVTVKPGTDVIDTGLKKFGALIGDRVEVGSHGVINPGCIIGAEARIYPLTSVRGCVPAKHLVKQDGSIYPLV